MPSTVIYHPLRDLIGSGRDDLRRQVQYLKAENEVLHAKLTGPIRVTSAERYRLIELGEPLGSAIRSLLSIVSPEIF